MKKNLFLTFLLALLTTVGIRAQEKKAYAVFDGTTLTFKYDANMPSQNAWEMDGSDTEPGWYYLHLHIQKVVFDASFAQARPTSMHNWFEGCSSLTSIEGMENLNTSQVTDMGGLFYGCKELTTIDLSGFDMSNVTYDIHMLTLLQGPRYALIYLPKGTTAANFTRGSFCDQLTEGFNLVQTTDGQNFTCADYRVYEGVNINVPKPFKAEKASFVPSTEWADGDLATVFLPFSFSAEDFGKVYAYDMSNNIGSIGPKKVIVEQVRSVKASTPYLIASNGNPIEAENVDVVTPQMVLPEDPGMRPMMMVGVSENGSVPEGSYQFDGSTELKIVPIDTSVPVKAGTAYFMLNDDFGPYKISPITIGMLDAQPPYVVYDSSTNVLTFYCDNKRDQHTAATETIYDLNEPDIRPQWYEDENAEKINITKVVIDPSFADARPTSMCYWFSLRNLASIEGMEYLNTSEVTDMYCLFYSAHDLPYLDMTNFDMTKVTNKTNMIAYKNEHTLIYLPKGMQISDFYREGHAGGNGSPHFEENFNAVLTTDGVNYTCDEYRVYEGSDIVVPKPFKAGKAIYVPASEWAEGDLATVFMPFSFSAQDFGKVYAFDMDNGTGDFGLRKVIVEQVKTTEPNTPYLIVSDGNRIVAENVDVVVPESNYPGGQGNFMVGVCQNEYIPVGGYQFNGTLELTKVNEENSAQVKAGTAYFLLSAFAGAGTETVTIEFADPAPGYAVYNSDSHELTFYYDGKDSEHTASNERVYVLNEPGVMPGWVEDRTSGEITKILFDPSFADARPVSLYFWFSCEQLTGIEGIEYLNTSETTDMGALFYGCEELKYIDISGFDMSKVTDINHMLTLFFDAKKVLIYLPKGTTASYYSKPGGSSTDQLNDNFNIVETTDGEHFTCADYRFFDGMDMVIPRPFTAAKASFTRQFTASQRSTIYLPFAFDAAACGKVFAFSGEMMDQNEGIRFDKVASTAAYTPYIIDSNGETVSAENVEIAVPAATEPSGSNEMVGVIEKGFVPNGAYCYDAADGKLKHVVTDDVSIKAGRAYFLLPSAAGASIMNISFDGEATGIAAQPALLNEQPSVWYTIDGRKLQAQPSKKGVYVVNGRKVIVK